jgi:hypothetical protein
MTMSRADLIDYLCSQQHAAWLTAETAAGVKVDGYPFSQLRTVEKDCQRRAMTVVLEELTDLGLLHEKTPAT